MKEYSELIRPKRALPDIWDIDINKSDALNFLQTVMKFNLNKRSDTVFSQDAEMHKRQRRNALHNIWNF